MKYRKLNEISTIIMGQSPNSDTYNAIGEGVPFFQGKADFGKINPTVRMYCSKPNKLAETSDILMSVRAPVGDVNIAREQCCIGRGLCAIRGNSYINNKFLYYYLITIKEELNSKATGSTFKAINKSILEELSIPNISLDKQNSIVEVLDKAQELIDKRKGQIEALDELVKSQFIEMFGDPVSNPKGFEVKNLSEIAESFIGLTYKPDDVSDVGTLVLRSGNIKNSTLVFNDNVRVNTKVREKLFVKENDILMCSRNGSARLVGKVAIIPKLDEEVTFGAFMTIIRSKNYSYLFTYFQLEAFRQQLQSAKTTTINQVTKKMLDEIKLPLPPIELQNQFNDFVKQVDKLKFEMEKSLKELEDNFNALMQKAFNGELVN